MVSYFINMVLPFLLLSYRGRKPRTGSSSVCRRGRQHTDDATGVPAWGQSERRAWWSTVQHGGTRWPPGLIHAFDALSSLSHNSLKIIQVTFCPSDDGRGGASLQLRVLSVGGSPPQKHRYSCSLNHGRCSWVVDEHQ